MAARLSAPASAYAVQNPERRTKLRPVLHDLLGSPEGAFTLGARAWYVAGRA